MTDFVDIYKYVQTKLSLGPANNSKASPEAIEGAYIARLLKRNLNLSVNTLLENKNLSLILYYIVLGLLSESVKSATCEGFAAVGLLKLLKEENWDNIYFLVASNKKDSTDNHSFLVLNVDKGVNFYSPESWKSGVLFDPYSSKLFSRKKEGFPTTLKQLTGQNDPNIEVELSLEKSLTLQEWNSILIGLIKIKSVLEKTDIAKTVDTDFKQRNRQSHSGELHVNYSSLKNIIIKRFQNEIDWIESMLKSKAELSAQSSSDEINWIELKPENKQELSYQPSYINFLNNSKLLFKGYCDSEFNVDAVAEIQSKEDTVKAKNIRLTLGAGTFFKKDNRNYFIIRNVNVPSTSPEQQSLSTRIAQCFRIGS